MFSSNGQISMRQTFRLYTYDLIGISTLLLPSFLAKEAGCDGFLCIVIGSALGVAYITMLGWCLKRMKGGILDYLEQELGGFWQKLILLFVLLHGVFLAGYGAYSFTRLMLEGLIREKSFWLILALVVLVSGYAVNGGMEGRARIYEVLFWFILIPLFLMLVGAIPEVDTDRWMPIMDSSAGAVLDGSYLVFLFATMAFWMMFFPKFVAAKDQGKVLVRSVRRAYLLSAAILAVFYLILLGAFGRQSLASMDYPAVSLMNTVQITGGFLKRTDAFMIGIWFFTLLAFLNTNLFYGAAALKELVGASGRKRYSFCLAVMVYLSAAAFYLLRGTEKEFYWYFRYIGAPVLVVLPLILGIRGRRKERGNSGENEK